MATDTLARTILVGLALAFLLPGCPSPCIEARYSFRIQGSFMPEQDSIRVGDTLFFLSIIPQSLRDENTGNQINYEGANKIGSNFLTYRLTGDASRNSVEPGVRHFGFYPLEGEIYTDLKIPSPDVVKQTSYAEHTHEYRLKFAMVAKDTGVYFVSAGNSLSIGRRNDRNCEKATFELTLANADQHLYYYQQARPGYIISEYEREHGYCFKVY